jgi:hypothetical protein
MSTKKLYLVLSPVQIGEEIFKEGTVECTPEEAAPVLATGSLKEAPVKSEKKENAAPEVPAETPAETAPAATAAEQQEKPAKKGGKKAGTK